MADLSAFTIAQIAVIGTQTIADLTTSEILLLRTDQIVAQTSASGGLV